MLTVTIRNLSETTHYALKERAARNGRSFEAEVRSLLDEAVLAPQRLHMGEALRALGRRLKLSNEDLAIVRDRSPAEPMSFD